MALIEASREHPSDTSAHDAPDYMAVVRLPPGVQSANKMRGAKPCPGQLDSGAPFAHVATATGARRSAFLPVNCSQRCTITSQ